MLKKNCLIFLIALFISPVFGQANDQTDQDVNSEITKIKSELETIKKDIQDLKEKTEWFAFRAEGYIKVKYGVNVLSKPYYGSKKNGYQYGFDPNNPVTMGFDFENNLLMYMDLADKVVATSTDSDGLGTQIVVSLKIQSLGISDVVPQGSWYVIQAQDDQGNTTPLYIPRNDKGGSNVVLGNFEFVLGEATVKNILGSGFFVGYKDVQEVDHYYGIGAILDIVTLNNEYFNNGFIVDRADHSKVASLYYSFDADDYTDYQPQNQVAEAVKLWSNSMLNYDPNIDQTQYQQKPHGMSFGYNKALSEGFDLSLELGASTKSAFDPKYYLKDNFDFGFFLKADPRIHTDKFEIWPKLCLSFAMQTETTKDEPWQWNTFAAGFGLPVSIFLPTGKEDYVKFEVNCNLNVNIVYEYFALLTSTSLELSMFDKKMNISVPFIYSFKNAGRGGFLRVGDPDVPTHIDADGNKYYWLDQLYDDHVLNLGLVTGFDSTNLFGDLFEYKITNSMYFAYMLQYDHHFYSNVNEYPPPEIYFYNIHRHEFIFNEFGPKRLGFYVEFGVGYEQNARLVDSQTTFKFIYDRNTDTWTDTDKNGGIVQWYRWPEAVVVSLKTGIYTDITKNFSIGLDAQSPKIHCIVSSNPIGDQNSFSLFILWSMIKF